MTLVLPCSVRSIARLVWRVKGDGAENVSDDIIVTHRSGVNVIDTIPVDMKTRAARFGHGAEVRRTCRIRRGSRRPRRDLGQQFTPSGYGPQAKGLAPGVYQIVAFEHSTVSGTRATATSVVVQVNANPRMFVGVPGNNQTVGSSFFIGGCLRHVYVHSSVAGTFNNVQVVRVMVR